MAGIFQKVIAKMKQEEKAKAKDDSSITKKPKPIVKPKPKAEDDFEIQKLLAWAKNNEPDEGWITNNKIKEIRLRKRYFDKNIDKNWLDYLSSKEKKGIIKIVKKSAVKVAESEEQNETRDTSRLKINMLTKNLENLVIDKLDNDEISNYANDFKSYFENIKLKLKKDDPMLEKINSIIEELKAL